MAHVEKPSPVGNATSWLIVLGSMRKHTEKAMRCNPISNTFPRPLYEIVPLGSRQTSKCILALHFAYIVSFLANCSCYLKYVNPENDLYA